MRKILIIIFIFLFFTHNVIAENNIFINEFLIDPTPQQVEIINTGTENSDISGWYIDDNGGTTYFTIPQFIVLYPNSCLVFSGDFNFNKSSADAVRIFNNIAPPTSSSAQLIDSYSYKLSPGAGISFFRLPDASNSWTTGPANLGKFNLSGNSCVVTPTLTPTPIPTPTATPALTSTSPAEVPTPTPLPAEALAKEGVSYENIFISEIMVNPPAGENEWIEIYNNNDFSVFLTNWFIDDIENGGSSPKMFSLEIPSKSYGVFELSSSMFNNSGDSVRLLNFNKNLKDSFEYSSSTQGKTYGRISFDNDDFCLQEPSKGNANNACINPTSTPQPTPIPIKSVQAITPTLTSTNPVSINRYIDTSNENITPINRLIGAVDDSEVLGSSSSTNQAIKNNHNKLLVNSLSFASFSYSLLTIVSSLIKMKKGL